MRSTDSPDHREVYSEHADQYELLISREDYKSNIPRELHKIEAFDNKDVVELGSGTGRLARMLAPETNSVLAFDSSHSMLKVAVDKLADLSLKSWRVAVADHRNLPIADRSADIVISGWSIVYLVVWHEASWERQLSAGLSEMKRVLRDSGSIIILETLGTGQTSPQPPDNLLEYFAFLERQGFTRSWIRTDYRFESLQEAKEVVGFFFGEAMLGSIVEGDAVTLPECTGVWQLRPGV